jgi:hypothetical protein
MEQIRREMLRSFVGKQNCLAVCHLLGLTLVILCASSLVIHASLPLETETARLMKKGEFEFNTAFEYQTSSDGKEYALPIMLEFGITDNLTMLIEPVPYTSIRPSTGDSATGVGDVEATLQWLFLHETHSRPAMALAGEIKFPTAKKTLIGTGKYDYTLYLIASKRFGDFDLHANIGYTFIGKPDGVSVKNTFDYAAAAEWFVNDKWNLVAEVYGNTSAIRSEGGGEGTPEQFRRVRDVPIGPVAPITPEISGSETVGTVGFRYFATKSVALSLGLSYDSNKAKLVSVGVTVRF